MAMALALLISDLQNILAARYPSGIAALMSDGRRLGEATVSGTHAKVEITSLLS